MAATLPPYAPVGYCCLRVCRIVTDLPASAPPAQQQQQPCAFFSAPTFNAQLSLAAAAFPCLAWCGWIAYNALLALPVPCPNAPLPRLAALLRWWLPCLTPCAGYLPGDYLPCRRPYPFACPSSSNPLPATPLPRLAALPPLPAPCPRYRLLFLRWLGPAHRCRWSGWLVYGVVDLVVVCRWWLPPPPPPRALAMPLVFGRIDCWWIVTLLLVPFVR